MKEALRIVFMGTPDFAVTVLDHLLKANHQIVGVITAPDKPAGRGRKLNSSAVKKYALEKDLLLLQPTNLKSQAFISELKALHAHLQIVVAFRMLPKVVWNMPDFGTFNLHASLLPNYRGAAPINWAIINGENKTGVTTFFIDEKIDTGAVILNREIAIEKTETAGELHDRLMYLGSQLVLDTIALIAEGNVTTVVQEAAIGSKTAYKIHRDTCKIDWSQPIDHIFNKIRGLSPYPAAWTILESNNTTIELKLFQVSKELKTHDLKIGTVVTTKKTMAIAVQNGFLNIEHIKPQGKKKMDIISFLNGFQVSEIAKVL
jgi:methionyl-tRNA formyltransferase